MHFLVTGGAGFIGTHLTLRLLDKGHRVTVLDNLTTGSLGRLGQSRAKLVVGSVLDKELVAAHCEECDCIIHLAAVVGVRLAMSRGLDTLKLSYEGTENVLEAASRHGKDIFLASSSAIYGKIEHLPVSEGNDSLIGPSHKPSWLYSVGKLVEEHLGLAYYREKGTEVKIGRFFNVIGPYQTGAYGMVVPNFVKKALKGERLQVYGDGRQTRTFVYIEDVIDGLELVIHKGRPGSIYNIGGTEEITILELANKVVAMTGSNSQIETIPYAQAFGEDFEETLRRVPDTGRLRQLGYSPRYTLKQALEMIISHHKSLEG